MTGRQGAEAVAWTPPEPEINAQSALRAKSLTQAGPLPPELPLRVEPDPTTLRDARDRAQRAAERIGGTLTALRDGQQLHGQLPSLAEQRQRHHESAAEWNAALATGARLAWAYLFHLPLKVVLNFIEWATEHPSRCLLIAGLLTLCAIFL